MTKCMRCNDTGVIETGNNDLPCECPAGDVAVLNVLGSAMSGAELKHRMKNTPRASATGDRLEFRQKFTWHDAFHYWDAADHKVIVVPPVLDNAWVVSAKGYPQNTFLGEDAEQRAFCVAATCARASS